MKEKSQLFFESITLCTISLLSLILMVYLSYNEKKLKEYPVSICSIIFALITLNQIIPALGLNSREYTTVEYGSFTIFNIVVIHTIFPLDKKLTILYSSSISLVNLVFVCFFLFKHSQSSVTDISRKVFSLVLE